MKKRILAILAAVAIFLSLAACTQSSSNVETPNTGTNETTNETTNEGALLFEEPTTIKLMISSSSSWPYKPEWPMWSLFEKYTGADFDILAIPTDMDTKVNLTMAGPQKDMPDMMVLVAGKSLANSHGPVGGFVAISDNLDKMPNYKAFWESVPEVERQECMLQRVSGDGKIYLAPNYGIQTVGNTRTWMYRKDIFDKHGLTPPETLDEMYETAKKLKELYPHSYPVCIRSGLQNFDLMGAQWKEYFTLNPYYDYNDGTWHYGAIEPEMKMMVEYFRKLIEEKLIMPDFTTIAASAWEELVSNDMGFMMPEYLLRMDFFNLPARQINPEFTLAAMMPPKANIATGQNKIANLSYELTGYVLCNTGDQKRIDNALKLLDWMYSPEGIQFQSWGEEGVTYEVVDGEKKWLVDELGSPYADLGMGTPGLYQVVEFEANEALYTEEQGIAGDYARPFQQERINPYNILAFPDEKANEVSDLYTEINTYVTEMISKFLSGLESMEKWDSYVETVKGMNVDRLLEMYAERYEEVMASDVIN